MLSPQLEAVLASSPQLRLRPPQSGRFHRQPSGGWTPPALASSAPAAPLRLHLALYAGDSDINSNFLYLQDPRPQGGSVWPFWFRMGVSFAWERRPGAWVLFPAHVPRYTLPNSDPRPRMWVELDVVAAEDGGDVRAFEASASTPALDGGEGEQAVRAAFAPAGIGRFTVSERVRESSHAQALAIFGHGGAGELKSNKVGSGQGSGAAAGDWGGNKAVPGSSHLTAQPRSSQGGWQSQVTVLEAQESGSGFQRLRSALYRALARHLSHGHDARQARMAMDPPKGTVHVSHARCGASFPRRRHARAAVSAPPAFSTPP